MKEKVPKRSDKIKKEFNDFAAKVAKLESLRHELNSLNTNGFEVESKSIRSKLKDVNAIPQIRRDLNSLKKSIISRAARNSVKASSTRKLLHKSKDLDNDQKIMKRKLSEMEKVLSNKKKLSSRKQLSRDEVSSVKELPKIENQLRYLRKDFLEHTRASKLKIDSGVGVIVDSKFSDFINDMKGELSERLRAKELGLDEQLKYNLNKQEILFSKRYKNLVDDFHKKYEKKVEEELGREVKRKFNEKLSDELSNRKKEMVDKLIEENISRLRVEKKRLVDKLLIKRAEEEARIERAVKKEEDKFLNEYRKKVLEFTEKMNRKLASEKRKNKRQFSDKEKENAEMLRKEREGINKRKNELSNLKEKHTREFLSKKNEMSSDLGRRKKELEDNFKRSFSNMRDDVRSKLSKKSEALEISDRKRAEKELKIKEDLLGARMEKEERELIRKHDRKLNDFLDKMHKKAVENKKMGEKLASNEKSLREAEAKVMAISGLEKKHRRVFIERKNKMNFEVNSQKKRLEDSFNKNLSEMKMNLQNELKSKMDSLKNNDEKKISEAVKMRERKLRSEMEKKYKNKLRLELNLRNAEIEKKKAELESHIMAQAKKLFK